METTLSLAALVDPMITVLLGVLGWAVIAVPLLAVTALIRHLRRR